MRVTDAPFPETPGERERSIEAARTRIGSLTALPPAFRDELLLNAHLFVEGVIETADDGTHFYGGQLGWTRWVIRNDHIDLVAALGTFATALVAFTAPVEQKSASAAVPLAFAVATVGRKARQKGALLEERDYEVLMTLKHIGPARPRWIADTMNGSDQRSGRAIAESDVESALRRLGSVRLGDGSLEAFAVQGVDGMWSANGC
jgi:hypothetical protein